jgi:hypothetical protein
MIAGPDGSDFSFNDSVKVYRQKQDSKLMTMETRKLVKEYLPDDHQDVQCYYAGD